MTIPANVDGRAIKGDTSTPVTVMNPLSVTLAGTIPGTVEVANDVGNPIPVSGIVTLPTSGYSAVVSLTRPNDTAPYAAGDVIGAATGSTAALEFTNMGPSGGEIMLTSTTLEIDVAAIPSGMTSFTLRLYSVTPPSALGDNAAWDLPAGDRVSYLGHLSLGTPVDLGSTLRIAADAINKQIKLAGTSIFAYLSTDGGYTPSALAVKSIGLRAVALYYIVGLVQN